MESRLLMKKLVLLLTLVSISSQLVGPPPPLLAAPSRCGGNEATIVGTDGDDRLRGTRADDVILGLGGDDLIFGGDGRDHICGGSGRDIVRGGSGSDFLLGDGGSDTLRGGRGDDNFFPPQDKGRDLFDGGHGNDFLFFSKAEERVVVDLGKGFFRIGDQEERLVKESFETVYGSKQADRILGDDEHNVLFGGFDSTGDSIFGRGGNDYLQGYENDDLMRGGSGDDVFSGFDYVTGMDEIHGGAGDDLVRLCAHFSGNGAQCGQGQEGTPGATIDLTAGTITGAGRATLTSIENAEGTAYDDSIIGSDASNHLYGGPGNDSISGGPGDDVVVGDAFAPLPSPLNSRLREGDVSGPDGNDDLDGGEGTDSLDGSGGDDTCSNGEQVVNCESQSDPSPSMQSDRNVLLWPFLLVNVLKYFAKVVVRESST